MLFDKNLIFIIMTFVVVFYFINKCYKVLLIRWLHRPKIIIAVLCKKVHIRTKREAGFFVKAVNQNIYVAI